MSSNIHAKPDPWGRDPYHAAFRWRVNKGLLQGLRIQFAVMPCRRGAK